MQLAPKVTLLAAAALAQASMLINAAPAVETSGMAAPQLPVAVVPLIFLSRTGSAMSFVRSFFASGIVHAQLKSHKSRPARVHLLSPLDTSHRNGTRGIATTGQSLEPCRGESFAEVSRQELIQAVDVSSLAG